MGFFSWITQDTERSISNVYTEREPFKVIMLDNKGNKWVEENYDGYGVFGGKDFYELLAEMNGVVLPHNMVLEGEDYTEYMRSKGIDITFKDNPSGDNTPGVLYPNLVESETWTWRDEGPVSCDYQGYFYPKHEEDEEDDDYLVDEWEDEYDDEI
jgi:hypothetical protein